MRKRWSRRIHGARQRNVCTFTWRLETGHWRVRRWRQTTQTATISSRNLTTVNLRVTLNTRSAQMLKVNNSLIIFRISLEGEVIRGAEYKFQRSFDAKWLWYTTLLLPTPYSPIILRHDISVHSFVVLITSDWHSLHTTAEAFARFRCRNRKRYLLVLRSVEYLSSPRAIKVIKQRKWIFLRKFLPFFPIFFFLVSREICEIFSQPFFNATTEKFIINPLSLFETESATVSRVLRAVPMIFYFWSYERAQNTAWAWMTF